MKHKPLYYIISSIIGFLFFFLITYYSLYDRNSDKKKEPKSKSDRLIEAIILGVIGILFASFTTFLAIFTLNQEARYFYTRFKEFDNKYHN